MIIGSYTDGGKHLVMCTIIQSLYCTSEINIILNIAYQLYCNNKIKN